MNPRPFILLLLPVMGCSMMPAPQAQADTLTHVFKRVDASVVVIETEHRQVLTGPNEQYADLAGMGSGVLISRDGKVITAAHLVQTADTILVKFKDGQVFPAKVLSSDQAADLALLQLKKSPVRTVVARLGDSDTVEVGDQVFVVGAPLGMSHTLTVGHISARRTMDMMYGGMSQAELLQTDAAINQGNSGGPLFNMRGEVMGIVSHIISKTGGYEGLGFVVTSNLARKLLLERNPAWAGLQAFFLKGDLAKAFNLPQEAGLLVQRVAQNSPAERLGLRPGTLAAVLEGQKLVIGGDVILEALGVQIVPEGGKYRIIRDRLARLRSGDRISVTVLREGRKEFLSTRVP